MLGRFHLGYSSKAALNKFHVFCQEKFQKVRESAKTKHIMKEKHRTFIQPIKVE